MGLWGWRGAFFVISIHDISALPLDFGSVMETLTPLGPWRDGELHPAGSACPDIRPGASLLADLPPQPRLLPCGNLPHCRGPCVARVPPRPHTGSSFPPSPSKHTPSALRGSQLAKAGALSAPFQNTVSPDCPPGLWPGEVSSC